MPRCCQHVPPVSPELANVSRVPSFRGLTEGSRRGPGGAARPARGELRLGPRDVGESGTAGGRARGRRLDRLGAAPAGAGGNPRPDPAALPGAAPALARTV